jgi:chromosome segregation ATPase
MKDRVMSDRPWLIALVVLILVSNGLLWRLVDQTNDNDAPATAQRTSSPDQPLLPAPTPGTSNKATAAEVDRLSANLDKHFEALQAKFDELPAPQVPDFEAATAPIRSDLQALQALGADPGTGAMESLLDGIRTRIAKVAKSTALLQSDSADKLDRSNDGIDATNSGLQEMSAKLSTSNDGLAEMSAKLTTSNESIAATNKNLDSLADQIAATNARITELGRTMESVDASIAELGGLRTDFQDLTAKMDALVAVACSLPLGPAPEACP